MPLWDKGQISTTLEPSSSKANFKKPNCPHFFLKSSCRKTAPSVICLAKCENSNHSDEKTGIRVSALTPNSSWNTGHFPLAVQEQLVVLGFQSLFQTACIKMGLLNITCKWKFLIISQDFDP